MKMMQNILCLVLTAVLFTACLVSCGEGSTPAGTDTENANTEAISDSEAVSTSAAPASAEDVAAAIVAGCSFTEGLDENKVYLETHRFTFSDVTAKANAYEAYVPSGITPQEVFVFEMKSAADTGAVVDKLNAYVEYQRKEYGDYKKSEVPKLDDPVIYVSGNYVVYVISADNEAAASVVKSLLK